MTPDQALRRIAPGVYATFVLTPTEPPHDLQKPASGDSRNKELAGAKMFIELNAWIILGNADNCRITCLSLAMELHVDGNTHDF
jgi:hypothetical protein